MPKRICSVPECDRVAKARGWCTGHYAQSKRGIEPAGALEHREKRGQTCRVDDCSERAVARGLCNKHYRQRFKKQDPPPPRSIRRPPEDRFWERVDKNGPLPDYAPQLGPCWLWTGKTTDRHGYGSVVVAATRWGTHRYAYVLLVGPVPRDLELDHLCRVPLCCNPAHLEAVTHKENLRRADWSGNRGRPLATHCRRGHPFDEENTVIRPNGKRLCRKCRNANAGARYHRRNHAR